MVRTEPPICTSQFGHVWDEWAQLGETVVWKDTGWGYSKLEIFQYRKCAICGYTQVDKQVIA
jgi:hypothetical protein